jgi:hypothetical protein
MHFEVMTLCRSLRSERCPACGRKKKSRQTFCLECYRALPKDMKRALYNRIGQGYEQAFSDALIFLEVETPAFPDPPIPSTENTEATEKAPVPA